MTTRVVVADDQTLVRAGFCGIIAATEGLSVVGQAANGAEVLRLVASGLSNAEIAAGLHISPATYQPRDISAPRPRRPTSPTCSPSWTPGTGSSS